MKCSRFSWRSFIQASLEKFEQNILRTPKIILPAPTHLWITISCHCSITVTNKQNHNVIGYDYIESNHDYNRDYICLETSL